MHLFVIPCISGQFEFACQLNLRWARRRTGRMNRSGCSDRAFCFCRRCRNTSRIPRALPELCVTHSQKYARKSQARPFNSSRTHTRNSRAYSFIHRLDNIIVRGTHIRARAHSLARDARTAKADRDRRPSGSARVDSARTAPRTASGSALERGRLSRANGSCVAIS